jgi:hypothetical protein
MSKKLPDKQLDRTNGTLARMEAPFAGQLRSADMWGRRRLRQESRPIGHAARSADSGVRPGVDGAAPSGRREVT